ncbi:MAG TPA: hypothetical protein VEA41_13860, partial [Salinarimonas sp.]|nr:hypothetical protein [Salinarimonas sp.]
RAGLALCRELGIPGIEPIVKLWKRLDAIVGIGGLKEFIGALATFIDAENHVESGLAGMVENCGLDIDPALFPEAAVAALRALLDGLRPGQAHREALVGAETWLEENEELQGDPVRDEAIVVAKDLGLPVDGLSLGQLRTRLRTVIAYKGVPPLRFALEELLGAEQPDAARVGELAAALGIEATDTPGALASFLTAIGGKVAAKPRKVEPRLPRCRREPALFDSAKENRPLILDVVRLVPERAIGQGELALVVGRHETEEVLEFAVLSLEVVGGALVVVEDAYKWHIGDLLLEEDDAPIVDKWEERDEASKEQLRAAWQKWEDLGRRIALTDTERSAKITELGEIEEAIQTADQQEEKGKALVKAAKELREVKIREMREASVGVSGTARWNWSSED